MKELIKSNLDHLIYSDVVLRLVIALLLGLAIGQFVRALYLRFSRAISNRDELSGIFVPLTVATVLVITVIKSSLALSLGLVGALSIVRFRAAIKDPEELVYLFFCIAAGLTLGAELIVEAIVGAMVFAVAVITVHVQRRTSKRATLLLTMTGDVPADSPAGEIEQTLSDVIGEHTLQRLEWEGGTVQARVIVSREKQAEVQHLIAALRQRFPAFSLSYVNLETLL